MEISFSIDNVNGEYNPYNTQGMAKYLMERQEVKTRYGLKLNDGSVEWIDGGTFYLSEWQAKQNGITADFKARDVLEFMSGIYEDEHDFSKRSLYDLAELVLTKAALPLNSDGTVKWRIDESLKNIYTYSPLPQDTLANCLLLIANRGKCVLYQDRTGTLRIEPFSLSATEPTGYRITSFNSYSKPEITLTKPCGTIVLNVHTAEKDEEGYSFTRVSTANLYMGQGESVIIDNPLIHKNDDIDDDDEFHKMATWVYDYLRSRMILKSTMRADVSLDALDLIGIENDYGMNYVVLTDVEFKFNGAFRGTCEGKVI
jgi:hypothetical protein